MRVEIWSDVVCPWCYIGKRRFESALDRFEHRDAVEIDFRSFELNPNAQADEGTNLDEMLARKYGFGVEQARVLNARVVNAAAGEGLHYRLDIAKHGNTMNAHRLIHLAAAEGRQAAMKERLLAAYFTEGKPVSNHDTLVELATEVGIDSARARAVLDSDEFTDEVHSDEREAMELGITGVPFFVINRRYGVSGAQPPDVLLNALETAWNEAHPIEAAPGEVGA
jgi:predicted DsbA family dithiol-disulfide isomerase